MFARLISLTLALSVQCIESQIEVVDFRPFLFGDEQSKSEVVSQIKSALETTGFFLVQNHGIPRTLVEAAWSMQRDFFHQNMAEKERFGKSLDDSPYGTSGWYRNELLHGSTADRKETYDLLLDSVLDHFRDGIWFDDERLSDFLDLSFSMKSVTQYLFNALSLALDGDEHFLSSKHDNLKNNHFRFVYYDQQNEEGLLMHPHTDFLSLTVGFQDEAEGLEVWDKAAKVWIEVPFLENTMIVNIGDAVQRWSNDRFIANFHRVRRVKAVDGERLSFYLFVGPDDEQMIDPADFGVADGALKHEPESFGDFFRERLRMTFERQRDDHHSTGDGDAFCDI